MKRETRKFFAVVLTLALVLTSVIIPAGKASAEDSKAIFVAADGKEYDLEVTNKSASLTIEGSWASVQNLGYFNDAATASTKDFTANASLIVNEQYTFTNAKTGLTCAQQYANGLLNMWGTDGDKYSADDGSAILYVAKNSGVFLRVGGEAAANNTTITSITYNFTFSNWTGPGGDDGDDGNATPAPGGDDGNATPAPGGDDGNATPAPGGDDGNATPAPGGDDGNATPAPGGDDGNNGGTTVTPTPDPNNNVKVTVKKVTVQKVKSPKKKTLLVQWKKLSDVTGYEVQIATKKNFKKGLKKYTVKKAKTAKKTIKKLKSKKKYFVRVRAYKTVSGKKYTGSWSKVKSAKIK